MNDIFIELMETQRQNLSNELRLNYFELIKLTFFINEKFFNDECCFLEDKGYRQKVSKFNKYEYLFKKKYKIKKKYKTKQIIYYNYNNNLCCIYCKINCKFNQNNCINPTHLIIKKCQLKKCQL